VRDLSDFERGQIVGTYLAGASVTKKKTATLLGVPSATVSKVMSAYTNHEKTTSAKRNSGRQSTLTERERDCFEKSENCCRTGGSRTEYSSSTKLSDMNFTSNIHGGAAIAKPLITERNAQMKPGHESTGNARVL
jgi:hypothetical protein